MAAARYHTRFFFATSFAHASFWSPSLLLPVWNGGQNMTYVLACGLLAAQNGIQSNLVEYSRMHHETYDVMYSSAKPLCAKRQTQCSVDAETQLPPGIPMHRLLLPIHNARTRIPLVAQAIIPSRSCSFRTALVRHWVTLVCRVILPSMFDP